MKNPAKTIRYGLALLMLAGVTAVILVVSGIFILAGFVLVMAALSMSGIILLGMKFGNWTPGKAPVLRMKEMWHWACEIPGRISAMAEAIMRRMPILGGVLAEIDNDLADDRIIARSEAHYRTPKYEHDPYRYGDLMRIANAEYPQKICKALWEDLALHLRVSLLQDSRFPNGKAVAEAMAPNVPDAISYAQCIRRGFKVGLHWFAVSLVLWHPVLMISSMIKPAPVQAHIEQVVDYWTPEERNNAIEAQAKAFKRVETLRQIEARGLLAAIAIPMDAAASLLFGLYMGVATARGMFRRSVDSRIQPFNRATPDALHLYFTARRTRDRVDFAAQVNSQIEKQKFDTSPILNLGVASGRMEFVGVPNAPREGAPMALSLEDLYSHLLITGGIGSGKTRTSLKPIIDELLRIKLEHDDQVHIFLTDDKGVLCHDAAELFKKYGIPFIFIGPKPGESAIDFFRGAEPDFIVNSLIAYLMQNGGGNGEQFFNNAADDCLTPCATILQAYQHTKDAMKYVDEFGELPYSFAGLERMATDVHPFSHTDRICNAVIKAAESGEHGPGFAQYLNRELWQHIEKMCIKWRDPGSEKTRSSIVLTIETIMSSMRKNPELNAAFGLGTAKNIVPISKLFETSFLINLPSGDYKKAGNFINQLILMRLFTEMNQRQVQGIAKPVQLIVDEAQELIAASGRPGSLDWGNYPGMSRSAKLAFIVATQQVNSIRQRLGAEKTATFLGNMRSRIVLPTEDKETAELVTTLVPKITHFKVVEKGAFESYHAMRASTGMDVFKLVDDKPRLMEKPTDICHICWSAFEFAPDAITPFKFDTFRAIHEPDLRFITMPATGLAGAIASGSQTNIGMTSVESYIQQIGAAHHKAEDLERSMLKDTYEDDAMKLTDLTTLFANDRALCFLQNSNGRRVDVVELKALAH